MGSLNKKQRYSRILRYLLLPIMMIGVAILLSRCGKAPTSPQTYKGASLVGEAVISYDRTTNTLFVQNFNPPNVTPPKGGAGFTVSLQQTGTPTFNGSQVTGALYITNASTNPALTGVVLVLDKAVSGSVTVANPDYGNGFRANNPLNGPWAWWFTAGTFPNYNIPSGGQSITKTVTFNATANFVVYAYIYAFCPSGVVENRNTGAAVPGAFVMLGNFPGDPNYQAEPCQFASPPNCSAGTAPNYLTSTDSGGYFALPITTVVGNYITYTVGARGNGTDATNAQYDNFTLWGTGLSYVVLPIRPKTNYSAYVAVGSTNGGSDVATPANLPANTSCQTNIPIGLMIPMMSFNDLINLSLSSLVGPNLGKSLYGDTTCSGTFSSTNFNLPSNIIIPAANVGPISVYTNASGSTSGLYVQTIPTSSQGKNYYVPAPQNSTFSMGGVAGTVPGTVLTTLSQELAQPGYPLNYGSLLQQITFKSFGARTGIAVGTSNIGSGVSPNISNQINTSYAISLGNLSTIFGTQNDPSGTYDVLGLTGLYYSGNPVDFQLTTQALASGNTASTSLSLYYVGSTTGNPTFIPAVIVLDLNSVNANFSATTAIAYRTGSTSSPAVPGAFNYWYKFIDLNWPAINPNNQQLSWTSAANSGVTFTAPNVALVDVVYPTSYNYTGLDGSAQTVKVLATAWEMLLPAALSAGYNVSIPTLPVNSPGILLTQPTYNRYYTVKILQGLARTTSLEGPVYTWDTQNNIATVMNSYILGGMDVFSLTSFPVGGGWIITPKNNASGVGTTPTGKAYINAYNWNIVSGGTPANLRGCFYVSVGSTPYWSNCSTGTTNCTGLPAITVSSPFAYQQTTLSISSGVYNSITFTPYNTTAVSPCPTDGSPCCQQVGESGKVTGVHN